jgi:hypothetical protein
VLRPAGLGPCARSGGTALDQLSRHFAYHSYFTAGCGTISYAATYARWCVVNPEQKESYFVQWSDEDQEWVATCSTEPFCSYLAGAPAEALTGLVQVLSESA